MKIYLHGSTECDPITTDIFGMSVVDKNISGLPYNIWIDPAASNRNVPHNSARVKVEINKQRVPYLVSDNPKCLVKNRGTILKEAEVIKWLRQNKDILLRWWRNEITDKEALTQLQPLK